MPRFALPKWPAPKWLFVIAAVAMTAGLAIPFHRHVRNEFDAVYRRAAGMVRAGEPLYEKVPLYTYPPFMAWSIIPFTYLERVPARIGWFVLNIGCLFAMVWLAWRMVFPKRSATPQSAALPSAAATAMQTPGEAAPEVRAAGPEPWFDRSRWLIFGFGLFLGLRPGTNSVLHHQTDLMMGVCLFLGLWALLRNWPFVASIAIGLAAAMKCTPALFVVYFLWRGPRLAAATLVLVAIGANLLPQLTHPQPGDQVLLLSWFDNVVADLLKPGAYPGQWNVDVLTNQSFAGTVLAWMTSDWSWSDQGFKFWAITPLISPQAAKAVVYAMGLILVSATLYLMHRRDRAGVNDRLVVLAELSSFLLLMLLLSPMSHKTHFTTMLLPALVVGLHYLEKRSRRVLVLISVLLLLQIASLRIINLSMAYWASWHGAQMLSTLVLLWCCWLVIEERLPGAAKAKATPVSAPPPMPTPAMPPITKAA
jgi:hypothetical protein